MQQDVLKQKNNIIRNSLWGIIYKVFALLTPFFIRTIIIHKLGMEYLGLNNLFASLLQILNMAELGFGSAVVYNLYKPLAEQDDVTINALIHYYKIVYRYIGIAILVIGAFCIAILPYAISGDMPNNINIYILYGMSLLSTVLSYLCFAYRSVLLHANQRKDIVDKIALICMFFKYSTQVGVLLAFNDLYLYYGIDIISTLLNNILIAVFVKKLYPDLNEQGILQKEIKEEIYAKVKGLMVYKLSGKTKNAFDSVVLSASLGLAVVAKYGNYYYILNNLVMLLTSITSAAEATAGNRLITQNEKTNHTDFMRLTFIHSWISDVCCVCLFCLYQHFMEMWVGENNMLPFHMVLGFSIYFFLLSSCESRNTYINAAGLWWENRFRAIGSAVMNLLFNMLLVKIWGISGVLLATIVSTLIFDVIFTSRTLYRYCFMKESVIRYFYWWVKQSMLTAGSCTCMYLICMMVKQSGIGGFIIKGIICVTGTNLIFILFRRNDPSFRYLIDKFRSLKKRLD